MSTNGWAQMAAYWDEKFGDEGDLWHRSLIDPPLLKLVGDVAGQRVLDLACGNGYLSRRFARQGATVTGVDASAPIIERAQAREDREPLGITYHIVDAAHLEMLADESFDLVFSNMALMDIEDAAGAIQEAARVLRPQGRFVASINHPCFDIVNDSGWEIEIIYPNTTAWRKVTRYRKLAEATVPWSLPSGEVYETHAHHRPLSWYFQALRAAGFVVAALEEPAPTEEFLANSPQGQWIAEIPLHCVLEAWKLSNIK